FERGVVSAEIDLGPLISEKGGGGSVVTDMFGEASRVSTGPAGVHDQLFSKMKLIADSFGGEFRVHAPMAANPADSMQVGQARAAGLLKQSLEYTRKLGGKTMTVHPIGQMEYYFTDPFVGTKMPVQNPFYLAKDEKEIEGLYEKLDVKDPLLQGQIKKEWKNWVSVLPTVFAEKFGALAAKDLDVFANKAARWQLGELAGKYRNDLKRFEQEAITFSQKLNPTVEMAFSRAFSELQRDPTLLDKLIGAKGRNENDAKRLWPKIAMASLEPLKEDGTRVIPSEKLRKLSEKVQSGNASDNEIKRHKTLVDKFIGERETERLKAWEKTLIGNNALRFGPFKESEEQMVQSVRNTFGLIFEGIKKENKALYTTLKNKKIKIGIENLFPTRPDKGYMQGYAYFYEPEHIARVVKEIRKEAKRYGLPEDIVTVTFDIGHAAASKHKPTEFLKKLKKLGVKPEYVHIVGGPGYGHDHIAWGDWLDEVSKMDPDIVSKLMDVGAINIEGGAGLHDVDVTLNALWDKGLPVEAMMAMSGSPDAFTPDLARYSGFNVTPYMKGVAQSYHGTDFPHRAFYSFQQETIPMPMRGAFGSYTAPGLVGGGYTMGPGRTSAIWSTAQPTLYSAKNEG
ncbi:MAG: hypothetical protein GOV01_01315, partial [Candidatus Altiarchaeota archaeon]|nr:hypothetical protein [Candidatus Altiarchaeota archaeon]